MYGISLTVVLAAGLAPALYFSWTFRPRRRFARDTFDAGAWVGAIALLYAWISFRNVVGLAVPPRRFLDGAGTIAVLGLVDVVLLFRAFQWRRLRREGRLPYLGVERRRRS